MKILNVDTLVLIYLQLKDDLSDVIKIAERKNYWC